MSGPPAGRSPRRPASRRGAPAALAALVVVLLAGGYAAADAAGAAPGVLTTAPRPVAPPAPAPAPGATASPAPPAALPALSASAPLPDPAVLSAALAPLLAAPALRGSAGASVVDAATGRVLVDAGAQTPHEPASVAKLFTSAAALAVLGPDATLATRAVAPEPGRVVLVGGGDQLLTAGHGDPTAVVGRAGLADLADATAAALRARGEGGAGSPVAVGLDDSLTGGAPQRNPAWGSGDVAAGYVAPLTSLAVDAGRLTPDRYAQRAPDPALAATATFAALLAERGVAVTGAPARTGPVPAGAAELAQVRSAPLADVVARALAESDNTVAEALARLVGAAAGRPPGFAESADAVLAALDARGVAAPGVVLVDGSGLAAGSSAPAAAFTALLAAAAGPDHPGLRPLLTALPVGGLSGTLAERFTDEGAPERGAGLVRAKTGSLTGVTSLVGAVVDADGRQLAFAVLADGVGATDPAREAVDGVADALVGCGCR